VALRRVHIGLAAIEGRELFWEEFVNPLELCLPWKLDFNRGKVNSTLAKLLGRLAYYRDILMYYAPSKLEAT
jgi:hypothetical protein